MAEPRKIRLLLADDHALVRAGIRACIAVYPSILVIGEAADGNEAVKKCKKLRPDVVLLDLNMPGLSGIEAAPLIRKSSPNTKILVLTMHDTPEYVNRLLRSGANGYVLKDTAPAELVRAISSVAAGQAFFSPAISAILLGNYVSSSAGPEDTDDAPASKREREVLQMVAEGKTSKEIALALKLSVRTVETYRVRLKTKLKARNVAEMLKNARGRGLI